MANVRVDYHPVARLEALDAFEWYQTHSSRAAENFQRELERAQAAIEDSPQRWPMYLSGTRHYLLKRFPYIVVYHLSELRIEILAVAHARREPGYWMDRMPPTE